MDKRMREDLGDRTRRFALAIVRLYVALPKSLVSQVLGRQLLRSGTSVGAHYREARRGKSNADFVSKMEGALQELDETGYWLELLQDANVVRQDTVEKLLIESNHLMAIFVSIVRQVKSASRSTA